ncbi:hypothetical protein CPB83DRAFT_767657 [Crepidotus variabilis]|uniref:Short-chain dehydrogenase/reductase n=1 Tax=Crepidotus variabilis TaxID=179855 RepID=A0A9P6JPU0_9AGAR|nr:hypothetical protein CPB83DRAFT_767657 [Crepidotus variabilis]
MTLTRIQQTRLANLSFTHLTGKSGRNPTAVFVGGTSGVGEGMARVFAQHTNGNADIIIVGRNADAAEKILRSLPVGSAIEGGSLPARTFHRCDVSLLKNVASLTKTILSQHPKINYLILTTGFVSLARRTETSEGLEDRLAVHYYSRWKFIYDLLPAIQKARDSGEEGGVMTVYGPNKGLYINAGDSVLDWDLKGESWSSRTYNNFMIESFAALHPSISFVHSHPGWVRTPLGANSPSFLIRVADHLKFLLSPWLVSIEEGGEYMWRGLYRHGGIRYDDEQKLEEGGKGGAWWTGWYGDDLEKPPPASKQVTKDRKVEALLWEHTSGVVGSSLKDYILERERLMN